MSQTVIVTCDQCGAHKEKTNHWFSVLINEAGIHIYYSQSVERGDFCSESCVIKTISQELGKRK